MIPWDKDKKFWPFGLPKCRHAHSQPVRVQTGPEGRTRAGIRLQCLDCGKLDSGDGEPMRLADHPDAPDADLTALAIWADARTTAGKAAQQEAHRRWATGSKARDAKSEEWFAEYEAYLRSPAWQRMRAFVLARDLYRCTAALAGCTERATEVHHDTSSRRAYRYLRKIGDTPAFMLFAVCGACHRRITEADRAHRDEETPKPKDA
jgi:hypothetical protein